MNQRIAKRTTGLVDYEELETNSDKRRQAVDWERWSINAIDKKAAGGESRG